MNIISIGYIHAKTIPGCSQELIDTLGILVDRMSVNIELPSQNSLQLLAPEKSKETIVKPMSYIANQLNLSAQRLLPRKKQWTFTPTASSIIHQTKNRNFVPAGQTTQLIVGATPETDLKIIQLSENLYQKFHLKRVYYSAYISVNEDSNLPTLEKPPLLRENRIYQADWLLRFYGFRADELLNEQNPNFNTLLDPKCDWAIRHLENFPVEVNSADYATLLRVPGIGVISAKRILRARGNCHLQFEHLKKLGVVLKRARYFITCDGKYADSISHFDQGFISENLLYLERKLLPSPSYVQTSLFDELEPTKLDKIKCLTGNF